MTKHCNLKTCQSRTDVSCSRLYAKLTGYSCLRISSDPLSRLHFDRFNTQNTKEATFLPRWRKRKSRNPRSGDFLVRNKSDGKAEKPAPTGSRTGTQPASLVYQCQNAARDWTLWGRQPEEDAGAGAAEGRSLRPGTVADHRPSASGHRSPVTVL